MKCWHAFVTKQRRPSPPLFLSFLIETWSESALLDGELVGCVIVHQDTHTYMCVTQSHCPLLAVDHMQKSQAFSTGRVLKQTGSCVLILPREVKSKCCFIG